MRIFFIFLSASLLFSAVFHGFGLGTLLPWHVVYSDIVGFADKALAPGWFLDKQVEYPVIIGLVIDIAAKLAGSRLGYYLFTVLFLALSGAATTYFLYRLTDDAGKKRLWLYWIFAPSMLFFSIYNWDLIAILCMVLSLYYMQRGQPRIAALWIACGFSAKFFPILLLVPLLIKIQSWAERGKVLGTFSITALLINLPFMIMNFDGWSYFFQLNQMRSSSFDSIWTIIRFITSPLFENISVLNAVSGLVFVGLFCWAMWHYRRIDGIHLSFLAVLIFVITNKVFSPQYLLWLLPFFVILGMPKLKWFYGLEITNLIILWITLGWHFGGKAITYFYWNIPFVLMRYGILLFILISFLKMVNKNIITRPLVRR